VIVVVFGRFFLRRNEVAKKQGRAELVKEIIKTESIVRKLKVELYTMIIDQEIKKSKPGENVACILGYSVPSEICDSLAKIYNKKGWEVSFPIDSRGDGGYIELRKLTTA
jgi:hypothetical protein